MKRHEFEQEFSAASPYCGAMVMLSDGTGDTCGLLRDDDMHITAGETRYRETLHRWAAQHVPEGARVTSVDIRYDDGWDPTFTSRPASLTAVINFDGADYGVADLSMEHLTSVGELLTALFAIEESE